MDLFHELSASQNLREFMSSVADTPIGGTADTVALLAIASSIMVASPTPSAWFERTGVFMGDALPFVPDALWSALPTLTSATLAAGGVVWLMRMFLAPMRERKLLRSSLNFKSSPPPMVPGSKPGMYFGLTTDTGMPIYVDDDTLTRHCLIVGQSGVGKTVAASLLMFQQIERGGGLLFIDPKVDYENIQNIYNFAVWAGRVDDLYILCPGDPKNSNTYNPVMFGDPDEVASRILGLIPSTESNAGSDYYKQAANQAIRAMVSALQFLGVPYSMRDLSILLDSAAALDALYTAVLAKGDKTPAAIELRLWVENFRRPYDPKAAGGAGSLDMQKVKQLLGGIAGRLQQFGTGTFGEVMNTYDPDIKLHDIIAQGKICYMALPTMGKDVAAMNLAKMAVSDLRTCVSWLQKDVHKRPKIPFQVFIDEAGSVLGSGEALARLTEQARSARIFLQLAVQNLAQFRVVSEELSEMVPGNTVVKMVFRLGSVDSPNELAELIGMKKIITRSRSTTAAKSTSAEFTKFGPGHTESDSVNTAFGEREEEDYIVHPDAIRRLDKGECIMVHEGGNVYDLRIPMMQFEPAAAKSMGPFVVKRSPVDTSKRGLFDLSRDVGLFTTNAPLVFTGGGGKGDPVKAEEAKVRQDARDKKAEGYNPEAKPEP